MIRLEPKARARLFALHSWTSVVTGLLLFVIAFTGTCAVFARDEFSAWSLSGAAPQPVAVTTGYDRAIRNAATRFAGEIGLPAEILMFTGHEASPRYQISVVAPHHGDEEADTGHGGQAVYDVDPATMAIIAGREGDINAIYQNDWTTTIGTFLVHLHTDLWLPAPVGRYITGVLGLLLMVSLVSGLLVYHRNLREALTLRFDRAPKVKLMDAHKLLGVWTFFFGVVIAFTGTLLSFAVSFLLPITAYVSFAGDLEKAEEAFLGIASRAEVAARTVNIDRLVEDARARAGEGFVLDRVRAINLDDRAATIDVIGIDRGRTHPSVYRYEGATGTFARRIDGLAGSGTFNKVLGIALSMHFADFGGPLVQFVWMLMGFCLSLVIATGLVMWIERRVGSARGSLSQANYTRMGRATIAVCAGLPLAVAACFYAERLIVPRVADPYGGMAVVFVLTLLAAAAVAFLARGVAIAAVRLLVAAGIALTAIPAMNMLVTGRGFPERLAQGETLAGLVDVLLAVMGLCLLGIAHRAARHGFIPARDPVSKAAMVAAE